MTQKQTLVHLSLKLRGLTKYQFDKLNIVPELCLTTTMGAVLRVETHKKWSPPPTAHNATPLYPSCWQVISNLLW